MLVSQGFDDLDEFVNAYRGAISREGMLLHTDTLYPEGTTLNIEITLADSFPLIHGTAGVVKLMPGDPQAGVLHSVVLEFLELEPESTGFVDRLVEQLTSEDVEPFPFYRYLEHDGRGVRRTRSGVRPDGLMSVESVAPDALDSPADLVTNSAETDNPMARLRGRVRARKRWIVGLGASCAVIAALIALAASLITKTPHVAAVTAGSFVPSSGVVTVSPADTPYQPIPSSIPLVEPSPQAANQETPPPDAVPPTNASSVQSIDVVDLKSSTVVTIEADGDFDRASIGHFMMTDNTAPRMVVYLYGIGPSDLAYRSQVGGRRLGAIRVWYHDDKSPVQLHIVLDFAHRDVVASSPEVDGNRLVVTLSDREPEVDQF